MSVVALRDPPGSPATTSKTLTPERAALAAATRRLAELSAEMATLVEPANKLAAVVGRFNEAERRRTELYAADTAILAEWLTSGEGDRPLPSPELIAVEREVVQLRREREAAESMTPHVQAKYMECHGRLMAAQREREAALYQAAAAAALAFIDSTVRPSIRAALEGRCRIESLIEVVGFGPGAANGGAAAGDRIRAALGPVLRTSVLKDPALAKQFLDRLDKDPAAELAE
jgi:hypothetical protein